MSEAIFGNQIMNELKAIRKDLEILKGLNFHMFSIPPPSFGRGSPIAQFQEAALENLIS